MGPSQRSSKRESSSFKTSTNAKSDKNHIFYEGPSTRQDEEQSDASSSKIDDSGFQQKRETLASDTGVDLEKLQPFDTPKRVGFGGIITAVFFGLVIIGSIAGIAYLLNNEFNKSIASTKNSVENSNPDSPQPGTTNAPVVKRAEPAQFTKAQFDDLWKTVQNHLFKVTYADQDNRKHTAIGILKDSRGWIIVNNEVVNFGVSANLERPAVDLWGAEPMISGDFAAEGKLGSIQSLNVGVITADSKHVTAISDLAINRDFQFQVDRPLVIAAPPANAKTAWLQECTIQGVKTFGELSLAMQKELGDRAIMANDQMQLIVHNRSMSKASFGAPIFSIDGALVALHFCYDSSNKEGYAIPIVNLDSLSKLDPSKMEPFTTAKPESSTFTFNKSKLSGAPSATPPSKSGLAKSNLADTKTDVPPAATPEKFAPGDLRIIDQLEAISTQCDAMDWHPKNESDYELVQDYIAKLLETSRVAKDTNIERDRRELIELEKNENLQSISQKFWPEDEEIKLVNELAVKTLNEEQGRPFYGYGEVYSVPANTKEFDGSAAVLIELIGTNQLVLMPISENMGDLLLKSRWLVLGVESKGLRLEARGLERPLMPVIYPLNILSPTQAEVVEGKKE